MDLPIKLAFVDKRLSGQFSKNSLPFSDCLGDHFGPPAKYLHSVQLVLVDIISSVDVISIVLISKCCCRTQTYQDICHTITICSIVSAKCCVFFHSLIVSRQMLPYGFPDMLLRLTDRLNSLRLSHLSKTANLLVIQVKDFGKHWSLKVNDFTVV